MKHSSTHKDVTPPIHVTTTYATTWEETERLAEGDDSIYFYSRYANPNTRDVEDEILKLCAPKNAQDEYSALVAASGMAAISSTLLALLQSGDEVVATVPLYGGTANFLCQWLPRWNIGVKFVSCDLKDAESQITSNTKVLWTESPGNPTNRLVPFEKAIELAKQYNLVSCIDATFAPPPLQSPLAHGFDLEIHAATKYLNGHSDVLAGVVVGKRDFVERVRAAQRLLGGVIEPHAAFLLRRGLQTLSLRIERIEASAREIAHHLSTHPKVARVHHLSLESHPDFALAREQMTGCGGIVAFDLREKSASAARRLVENLRLIQYAPSLGGTETLISYPPLSSQAGQTDEQLREAGITRSTLRLSIGLEDLDDLWNDLAKALDAV